MLNHEAAIEEKLRTTEADLTEKIDVLRSDLVGVEQRLEAKIDGVEQRLGARIDGVDQRLEALDAKVDGVEQRLEALDAKIDGVERRLTVAIHSEVSSAVGHAVERFSEYFDLFDEKHGPKIAGLRQDLDEHRFDRDLHVPAGRGPRPRSKKTPRKTAARPASKKKKAPPRR